MPPLNEMVGREGGPRSRWYPEADDTGVTGWAHASGWAQLYGTRRSVSCVIPAHNHLPQLRQLLPLLSDLLTECGYPWETIVVDSGSTDGTEHVLRAWCELPGYRLLALDDDVGRATAVVLGLEAARGDAVILLDVETPHPLSMISEMVLRWEAGAGAIYAAIDPRSGDSELRAPGQGLSPADSSALSGLRLADDRTDLVLLDKLLVRELLR
jgi:glycosyltransferase involved in cell wall biosynthesis